MVRGKVRSTNTDSSGFESSCTGAFRAVCTNSVNLRFGKFAMPLEIQLLQSHSTSLSVSKCIGIEALLHACCHYPAKNVHETAVGTPSKSRPPFFTHDIEINQRRHYLAATFATPCMQDSSRILAVALH